MITSRSVRGLTQAADLQELAVKGLGDLLHTGSNSNNFASAALLVDVIGHYYGPAQVLEDVLQDIAKGDVAAGKSRSQEVVEALIQRLIDATEESDLVSQNRA
jgi:hypothetical protein